MEWLQKFLQENLQKFFDNFYSVGLVNSPEFSNGDPDGRFFLVVYNSSTTVSASYATFIVLAISFGIAAVFGAAYYGIAAGATGNLISKENKMRSPVLERGTKIQIYMFNFIL